jgi:hypothetical protein
LILHSQLKRKGSYVNNISSYKKDSYEWKLRMAIERCAIDDSKNDDIMIAREYIESLGSVIESYVFQYEEDTPLNDITPLVLSTLDFSDEEKEVLRIISKLELEKKQPIEENNNARIIELRKSISKNKTAKDFNELDLRYTIKKHISNVEFTTSDIYNARGYFYALEGDIEQVEIMIRSVIDRMRTMTLKELYEYYREYGDFIKHFQYFSDIVFCCNNIRFTKDELEILMSISQLSLKTMPQK